MTVIIDPSDESFSEASSSILNRIAEALGQPVTAFFDPHNQSTASETAELMELWSACRDATARASFLAYAREHLRQ